MSYILLLVWITSMLAATFLGYDRGRWEVGFLLGLVCGPCGVIAAGMLLPSPARDGAHRYQVERQMGQLRRADKARVRERKEKARVFDDLVHALEEQVEGERAGFAEELDVLAGKLEEIVQAEPGKEQKLRSWIRWLNERAERVRATASIDEDQAL